ncbi:hypothetical protein Tsubulata_046326 [Turnera subulata]|uniref:Uncharacterized protein n=1 Tax=Turnera subulata TaxID=218843 RepID=A0A9Q0J4R7_9ROSI|nr:hypothetical protein Tsubulata_046326 [Turnera subulata]
MNSITCHLITKEEFPYECLIRKAMIETVRIKLHFRFASSSHNMNLQAVQEIAEVLSIGQIKKLYRKSKANNLDAKSHFPFEEPNQKTKIYYAIICKEIWSYC